MRRDILQPITQEAQLWKWNCATATQNFWDPVQWVQKIMGLLSYMQFAISRCH